MEIRYRIMLMEESGFFYKRDFDYNSINISDVAYQFSHTISAITNNEEIALNMVVEIIPKGSNEILAREIIYTVFKIEPFNKVIKIIGNGIRTTEPRLIDTFINITIGALRGMLVKNLKGTPLAKSVMPLIPMDIIRQNTARLKDDSNQME